MFYDLVRAPYDILIPIVATKAQQTENVGNYLPPVMSFPCSLLRKHYTALIKAEMLKGILFIIRQYILKCEFGAKNNTIDKGTITYSL